MGRVKTCLLTIRRFHNNRIWIPNFGAGPQLMTGQVVAVAVGACTKPCLLAEFIEDFSCGSQQHCAPQVLRRNLGKTAHLATKHTTTIRITISFTSFSNGPWQTTSTSRTSSTTTTTWPHDTSCATTLSTSSTWTLSPPAAYWPSLSSLVSALVRPVQSSSTVLLVR